MTSLGAVTPWREHAPAALAGAAARVYVFFSTELIVVVGVRSLANWSIEWLRDIGCLIYLLRTSEEKLL